MASLGLGMFAEHNIAAWLEAHLAIPDWSRFVTAHGSRAWPRSTALTFTDIVLGEMVPKSLALQHAERLARVVYWPMRVASDGDLPARPRGSRHRAGVSARSLA